MVLQDLLYLVQVVVVVWVPQETMQWVTVAVVLVVLDCPLQHLVLLPRSIQVVVVVQDLVQEPQVAQEAVVQAYLETSDLTAQPTLAVEVVEVIVAAAAALAVKAAVVLLKSVTQFKKIYI